jgi:hypothetical protein
MLRKVLRLALLTAHRGKMPLILLDNLRAGG